MTQEAEKGSHNKGGLQAGRLRQNAVLVVALLVAVIFAGVITITVQNNSRLMDILEESVRSELVGVCIAARNDVDMDLFLSINSQDDIVAHQASFDATIEKLRDLKNEVGATYIYALKEIDGSYYFIFDTDEEAGTPDNPIFDEYELSPIHERAFAGESGADIMNVEDEYGSFNTGAIPLYHEGKIVGVISVDIEDAYIERSRQAALMDEVFLIAIMVVSLGSLVAFLIVQMRRNKKMHEDLNRLVNNDYITDLPNRYYFFSYFSEREKMPGPKDDPYALLFIDLDNFKRVNDGAGHDVGDHLLRLISGFLRSYSDAYDGDSSIQSMTARIGGDEFLQTMPGVSTADEVERRVRVMFSAFAATEELKPFIEKYDIGLSIGAALFPSQSRNYDELAKFADIAMYHAKRGGKNEYALYDPSMGDAIDGVELSIRCGPSSIGGGVGVGGDRPQQDLDEEGAVRAP